MYQKLLELLQNRNMSGKDISKDPIYKSFLEKFPSDQIENLSLNDYCMGDGKNSSFCWWIERGLEPLLGGYGIGSSNAHMIFKDKESGGYKKNRIFSQISDDDTLKIVTAYQGVIATADMNDDISWIDDNDEIYQRVLEKLPKNNQIKWNIVNGMKLRLLSCYYPDKILPINSSENIRILLSALGENDIPSKDKPIALTKCLFHWFEKTKNDIDESLVITPKDFIDALLSEEFGVIKKKEKKAKKSKKTKKGKNVNKTTNNSSVSQNSGTEMPALNTILYGPPGTGKTYNTIDNALKIIDFNFFENNKSDRIKLKEKFDKLLVDAKQIRFVTFHQSYSYEEFVQGIRADTVDDQIKYYVKDGIFKEISDKAKEAREQVREKARKEAQEEKGEHFVEKDVDKYVDKYADNYVLIIDEINRGNISKIFGELITLIEDTKRAGEDEALSVTLPYKNESFSVPKNLYIIGTMNTADRSLALMDTALRRRFEFIEMMPDYKPLENLEVEGVKIKEMLETMNQRIEVLYDREHTLGHAFFMSLTNQSTIDDLAKIFKNKIIPLLQEYFFDEWEKIRIVLGDDQKKNAGYEFVKEEEIKKGADYLFSSDAIKDNRLEKKFHYSFNELALKEPNSYIGIYEKIDSKKIDTE